MDDNQKLTFSEAINLLPRNIHIKDIYNKNEQNISDSQVS